MQVSHIDGAVDLLLLSILLKKHRLRMRIGQKTYIDIRYGGSIAQYVL